MGQVVVNKNTMQNAMTTVGLTGSQVIKLIPASRLYVKAVDTVPLVVGVKSNGVTPTGWTDLGIVDAAKPAYTKNKVNVETGIDKLLQAVYTDQTKASVETTLLQFDDTVLAQISGLTPSVMTSGSIVSFPMGSETVVQKAVLLVSQNKLDGKEMQFYHPSAYLTFSFDATNNALMVKLTADFPMFTMNTITQIMALQVFA